MNQTRVIVVGGGIVGLATAYRLVTSRPGWTVTVIEKETSVAAHQTGNNSGVIHSGIYYKPGSLKARLCVQGSRDLVDFCRTHDVPHRICGKIVLATSPGELPGLEEIARRGRENGLEGLRWLEGAEIAAVEPNARGLRALWVPQTGIVDYTRVAERLADVLRDRGSDVRLGEKVIGIEIRPRGDVVVRTDRAEWTADRVVTCAGLHSDRVARMTDRDVAIRIVPFRGEYYKVRQERVEIVRGLIYPVPDPRFPFLGVHFTRMIDGGLEAGPNAVLALKREGYRKTDIDLNDLWETLTWPGFHAVARKYWKTGLGEYYRSFSKKAFTKALQRMVPEVREDDLMPGGAGVRAQASERNGALMDDFSFVEHGPVLHVCNAPSPAATASLAIGDVIANRVAGAQ
ncbi:MAG: L-2-hydroxyglutarate oxidase [Bacteroidetes bacterium]|nr:L-2-hydroxyglutarate oxidase [Bacteroidota bacterium]